LDSLSDEQAEAFICCISAAISCAEISWKMNSSRGGVVDFPGISFCHFTAARMLLMGLQNGRQFLSNEYVTKCAIALEQCRTLLRESGKKWNMIRLQSEALEDTISSIRPTLPDGVCALWTLAESTANTVPANVYPININ
jgi:amino acid transporter